MPMIPGGMPPEDPMIADGGMPPDPMMGAGPAPLGPPGGPPVQPEALDAESAVMMIVEGLSALLQKQQQQDEALTLIEQTAAMMRGGPTGPDTLDMPAGVGPEAGMVDAPMVEPDGMPPEDLVV